MKVKLISSLVFLFSLSSFSQQFTVKGSVNDEKNIPIAYCNVTLTEISNNAISGTTTDDDGTFLLENLKQTDYILNVSFLGFKSYRDTISLKKNLIINDIVLEEQTQDLDGVTVVAKRPTVKRQIDRLVFNVENSTLSNNNVLDVLKNTPGVFVNNGEITIKNSKPIIYINDKKVHLSSSDIQQLLEGTSANTVKSIEVITNPPAKYEAEGGSVINIVTSKNVIAGYNGSVFGNYKQGQEYAKYALGTSHFFKNEVVDAYLNYNISPRKDYRHNNESINFIENNQTASSWETDLKRVRETANQTINGNIDFKINENNSLGITTNVLMSPRDYTKTSVNSITEVFNPNKALDSTFQTVNKLVDETYNLAFTLDYVHKFKKEGEKISANSHYTNYDFSSYQNVDTGYFLPDEDTSFRDNRFQTYSSQKIKLYTGQIDYELPIHNNTGKLETGLKVSNINSESILNQYIFENGVKIEDSQNSDTFLYDEMNYAGYASYTKDWDSWSIKTGLRTEYTDIKGNSLSTNQVNNSDYIKFFPSIYLFHSLNENNEIYFNYNKRISRPRYSDLNPFKYFLNDKTYITGDPNLKPEVDDVFTLGYTFNKKYTFEAYYRYENNTTLQIIFQNNDDNIIKYINTNIDHSITYGLDFTTYTQLIKNWNIYVLSSVFYYNNKFFALESNNELLNYSKWSVYSQIINYFTFLKDKSLTANVSYMYISPLADGPSLVSARSALNIGFKKTFFNNKASLNIGIEDVFNSQIYTISTKYLNQDVSYKSRLENRLFVVGFNYKFGNTRLKNNQKDIDTEERNRLNSNSH